jgi:hypothetical protein
VGHAWNATVVRAGDDCQVVQVAGLDYNPKRHI